MSTNLSFPYRKRIYSEDARVKGNFTLLEVEYYSPGRFRVLKVLAQNVGYGETLPNTRIPKGQTT